MKLIQGCLIFATLAGIIFVTWNLHKDDLRDADPGYEVHTAVIGNSHSSNLLLDESLNPYYLNIDGASMIEKSYQLDLALNSFPSLKTILINLSPAEFINCRTDRPHISENLGISGSIFSYPKTVWIKGLLKSFTLNPTSIIDNNPARVGSNGRILWTTLKPGDYERLSAHFLHCGEKKSLAPEVQIKYLNNMLTLAKSRGIFPIIHVTPHHHIYRQHFETYHPYQQLVETILSKITFPTEEYCFFDMYTEQLEDQHFIDGDHLSYSGSQFLKEKYNQSIKNCLNTKTAI